MKNLGERWAFGTRLYPSGDRLVSAGGGYQMGLGADGNLFIDDLANGLGNPGHPQWRASEHGLVPFSNPAYAILAPDGEIAIYDTTGAKRWSTGLHAPSDALDAAGVLLQTDGNAVLYDARGVSGGGARWASQPGLSHSVVPDWLREAASYAQAGMTVLGMPLANFNTMALTGQSPIAALKADVAIAVNDKTMAEAVTSGDYAKAWSIATQGGKVFDAALPTPPGAAYANGYTVPADGGAPVPPAEVVTLHLGGAATAPELTAAQQTEALRLMADPTFRPGDRPGIRAAAAGAQARATIAAATPAAAPRSRGRLALVLGALAAGGAALVFWRRR